MSSLVVSQQEDRFEIEVDGKQAGFLTYRDQDGQRTFVHTEVDDDYSGQGLAGELVRQVLDSTRAAELRVLPLCPYVAKYVARHHDWDDIVDPA